MDSRHTPRELGAVLLLTLMMLAVLAAIVIQGMRSMQVNTAGAMFYRNGIQADALALSGVRMAQALLNDDLVQSRETGVFTDTLLEDWARFPECEYFVPPDFATGQVALEIVDEQGKFPVNTVGSVGATGADVVKTLNLLVAAVLRAAGMSDDNSQEVASQVVWALKDWVDTDRDSSVELAEQDAGYVNVEEDEGCRNAPLTNLREIFLVLDRLGLEEEVASSLYLGKAGVFPGLRDLLTLNDFEGININTAHPFVLQALARDVDEDVALSLAQAMDRYRRDPWNRDQLAASDWYRELAVEGSAFVTFPGAVTKSSWFSVQATGTVGAISRTVQADMHREGQSDPQKGIAENVQVRRIAF
ncbi:MAG: hypothetical protein WC124_11375 [Desulfoplanes sp.]